MTNVRFGLKICTNVKNKYEKGMFDFFLRKKSLDLIMLRHFHIGFGLVTIF
jgi:hypothetical protein